jgi:hypothetical protein
LLAAGALRLLDHRDHALTSVGETLIDALGLDLGAMRASRRVFARSCLDWTQRRPHLAAALPAALTQRFLADGWLVRGASRTVRTAPDYDRRLELWLARAAQYERAAGWLGPASGQRHSIYYEL